MKVYIEYVKGGECRVFHEHGAPMPGPDQHGSNKFRTYSLAKEYIDSKGWELIINDAIVEAVLTKRGNVVFRELDPESFMYQKEQAILKTNPNEALTSGEPCWGKILASGVKPKRLNTINPKTIFEIMSQEIPVENGLEKGPKEFTNKEFVIDVKNLNIKEEIKKATVEFVNLNATAQFEKTLGALIAEHVKKLTPNYVKIGERKQVKIEGRLHKAFEDVSFLAQQHGQVFISGPAGSGKTTLGEQVAKAFGLKFAHISCSAGISEAHLLGRMLFNGEYISSDFVELYENGGVFLADEIDAADANTLLILNSGLANGYISVPNRKGKTHAKRHKDFFLIASANTWGNGSFEYHGRNHLDAAFMDRFAMGKVSVDYDRTVEKEYCSMCPELATVLWTIRKNCDKNKVRKIVSTRAFKEGSIQMAAGKTLQQVISRFTTGWSKEEIAKVVPEGNLEEVQEEQEEEQLTA